MRTRSIAAAALFAAGLACSGVGALPPSPEPAPAPAPPPKATDTPSFLVIVADDLGTDKVGAYGEHPAHPPTPNLDALAADGVLFRNAYTYPTCSASRAALLTGRYGRRNGMGGVVEGEDTTWELPLAEQLIPEVLRAADPDRRTVALGKWHLSGPGTPSGERHPNLQGFEHYAGSLMQVAAKARGGDPRGPYYAFRKTVDGATSLERQYATADTTDDAIDWLARLDGPFFLWVAYNAPHIPFHVPPPELLGGREVPPGASDVVKFDAAVEAMDREIGRLLAALTPAQRRTTTIVFIGDNGTDRGVILPPLDPEHGKASLYEGGTNVPLIVSGPAVGRKGAEAGALVHAVDLLPTVAELARVDVSGLPLDGVSFVSVLKDPASAGARRSVYTERYNPIGAGPYDLDLVALRDDRYKLLRDRKGAWWFFDLQGRTDDGPGRKVDTLRGPEKARYEALRNEIDALTGRLRFEY